ncbi:hypothetical protein GOP47_0028508 [Adiantum capillus-veneris]|nr:hypothetical protein GOP47_0028508 [Adiantum capillus-veneris]
MALVYSSVATTRLLKAESSVAVAFSGKATRGRASRLHFWPSRSVVRAQQPQAAPPTERFDVSSNCVQPVYRSIPSNSQKLSGEEKIKVLFISESNVCRSVYAEAMFNNFIKEKGLQDLLECTSMGTRDYNEGEKPDGNVLEVAGDLGLDIKDHSATVFDCARDVVVYDMLLVMDKFTASDVLKDITLYETIDKNNDYCWKVRRLGEFCLGRKIDDIDDPLYGNVGGEQEVEELHRVALDIHESCNGLMKFLSEVQSSIQDTETLKQALARTMEMQLAYIGFGISRVSSA